MSENQSKEAIERRSEEAFARSGWRDPRADYRAMLRRLREQDTTVFETAVREYQARVMDRLTDASADPVAAWLDYGRRLAELSGGGRTVRIDGEGRSEPDAGALDEPRLLLQLPADESAAAIMVAEPREPSPAQRAAVALLADRRNALPA